MLEIGSKAPAFTLPDQNGDMRSLADYQGKKVILYFYPKDMTAGCTKQACAFGELYPQGRSRCEQGQRGVSQEVRGEIRSALYPSLRSGEGSDSGL